MLSSIIIKPCPETGRNSGLLTLIMSVIHKEKKNRTGSMPVTQWVKHKESIILIVRTVTQVIMGSDTF